ncbi:MAG: ShlB/FhaC/HecB family hemolysin secretion/activation protein [Gammaproteobacteria bacterium]|nr:ShlB/FhaC/HecB family hemolysin secretion/activation protein [Gammaproteobacteria bacterium]
MRHPYRIGAVLIAMLAALAGRPSHAAAAPARPKSASQPAAADAHFDIWEFRVLGNHVLPIRAVESAVYPFLGPDRSIATVKQAATALEKAYKDAGFGAVYVDIPVQTVRAGVVRLRVTEGRIDRVHVRGDRYFSDRQIRAALPAVQAGQTLALPALQQQLQALNGRTADRVVTPILKSGRVPGTLDVDLAVKDHLPLHGSLQYDDRHTADTTPNRATATLSYDNLWQRQDSLSLEFQTAPAKTSDAKVLVATYLAHLGASSGLAAFSYIRTTSDVVALGTLGVLGKGSIFGAHYIRPLTATTTGAATLNLGADYKDVLTSVLPAASSPNGSGAQTGPTAVTATVHYVNWSAAFSASRQSSHYRFGFTSSANFGLRGRLNSVDAFANSRYNARANYFDLRIGLDVQRDLPWGFALASRLTSQWADAPLVNNEQFALGGVDTVRGYLEAETLGDSGAAGSLELHGPALGPRLGSFLAPLYAYGFLDAGVATLIDPLPGQSRNLSLWSDGAGVRLDQMHGFSGDLDYAMTQRDGVRTRRHVGHIDFSVRYAF